MTIVPETLSQAPTLRATTESWKPVVAKPSQKTEANGKAPSPSDPWMDPSTWRGRKLKPSLLLVHDIGLDSLRPGKEPRLELGEVPPSAYYRELTEKELGARPSLTLGNTSTRNAGLSRIESQKMRDLEDQYGWLQALRLPNVEDDERQCRWIHISSKFPENLQGVLLGLSDWSVNLQPLIQSLRHLDRCVYENERYSKHGKYFSPFFQPLTSATGDAFQEKKGSSSNIKPLFMSIPFLDWTVYPGPVPPLRFQVDEREGFFSSKSSVHTLRSLLQYYYRLEDTGDRERTQVYSKHRPWQNDRDLDLKVRRWYGHHPTGLNVDELWVLVVDARHIVTFSSNQTYKSKWPPQQLVSRIAEVSFRGTRDHFFTSGKQNYTSMTHLVTALHGAVGILHRSFWADMPLPCTDRYASYLGHLQYRLHRHATTKLVMDLLQVQDELTIILRLSRRQAELIAQLRQFYRSFGFMDPVVASKSDFAQSMSEAHTFERSGEDAGDMNLHAPMRAHRGFDGLATTSVAGLQRNLSFFLPADPLDEVVDHLQREIDDLAELHANSNELVDRTVQLVNIRLEDHGQAILVFTAVTVLFLPLNFVTSFFGMNTRDIRTMGGSQSLFWIAACALTAVVVVSTGFLAFYGPRLKEALVLRQEGRSSRSSWSSWSSSWSMRDALSWSSRRSSTWQAPSTVAAQRGSEGFVVLDAGKVPNSMPFPKQRAAQHNRAKFRSTSKS